MTRALICTGVLGGGTALVFALALAVSALFPQGSLLPGGWNGAMARPMFADELGVGGFPPGQVQWVGDGDVMDTWQAAPGLIEPAVPVLVPVPAPAEGEA